MSLVNYFDLSRYSKNFSNDDAQFGSKYTLYGNDFFIRIGSKYSLLWILNMIPLIAFHFLWIVHYIIQGGLETTLVGAPTLYLLFQHAWELLTVHQHFLSDVLVLNRFLWAYKSFTFWWIVFSKVKLWTLLYSSGFISLAVSLVVSRE